MNLPPLCIRDLDKAKAAAEKLDLDKQRQVRTEAEMAEEAEQLRRLFL